MPILSEEIDLYPSDLLTAPSEGPESDSEARAWWIFCTRPRQEKCLARELVAKSVAFYLPLIKRRLLIRGRPVHSNVPLFSGYVFVYGNSEDRLKALTTQRAAHVLPVEDNERLRQDLSGIQYLIASGAPLTVESRLEPNQRVRIRSGAFEGLEGIILRRKLRTRLVVWIQMLQQGVSLEIEDYLLEPI